MTSLTAASTTVATRDIVAVDEVIAVVVEAVGTCRRVTFANCGTQITLTRKRCTVERPIAVVVHAVTAERVADFFARANRANHIQALEGIQ